VGKGHGLDSHNYLFDPGKAEMDFGQKYMVDPDSMIDLGYSDMDPVQSYDPCLWLDKILDPGFRLAMDMDLCW